MVSALNQIAAAIAMDRWEEIGENTDIWNPKDEEEDIACDPLYIICSQVRLSFEEITNTQLIEMLTMFVKDRKSVAAYQDFVTPDDIIKAREIRNHFRNKVIIEQLKGDDISDFLKGISKVLENDKRLNLDLIPTLVKLEDFYHEDMFTSDIFKRATFPRMYKKTKRLMVEGNFQYQGSTFRRSRDSRIESFYFIRETDKVLCVATGTIGSDLHDYWKQSVNKARVQINGPARKEKQLLQSHHFYRLERDATFSEPVEINNSHDT